MLNSVQNYCNETTLHGFKYFTTETCRFSEKVFWFISLIVSFLSAVLLINKLHTEMTKTSIVTVTSSTAVPVEEIPFPAITFCTELRIQEGEPFHYLMLLYFSNNYEFIEENGFVESLTKQIIKGLKTVTNFCMQSI
jgi:acid-sensing ion channel, other